MNEKSHAAKLFIALGLLWRRKGWIILGTLAVTAAAAAYSLMAPKIYVSRAVIYPQDISANADKSGMNGLSGALNPVQGMSHLNRVELIVRSREMARQVLLKNDFMSWLYPGRAKTQGAPTREQLNEATGKLRDMVSTQVDVYKMTLEIKASAGDPQFAFRIAQGYLDGLNDRMKQNVIRNADANKEFLEKQMDRTVDPWAREKIQQLIIREIDTSMLLNANGFEILEAPEVAPARESPRRKRIVLLAAVLGLLGSCLAVLLLNAARDLRAEMSRSPGF
jgi:LPS O-antigen subunit length determinant protein (WzzB/FepE family)